MNTQWQLLRKLKQWIRQVSLGIILGIFLLALAGKTAAFFEKNGFVQEVFARISENKIYTGESSVKEEKNEKVIALTFDDGPHEKWTLALLDGLKERGVKATFFLMGENIAGNEELVQRMAREGHLIGNHSYTHVQLTKEGMDEVCESFEKTSQIIEELTGERPQYVRPPYGDWNEELECRTNLTTVLWDVDSLDWKYKNRKQIADKVCREAENGDIVLMHDIFSTSQEAAMDIIDRLKAEGWKFVTADEILID